LLKYVTAASQPAFWPALARQVMPTVEHAAALRAVNARTVLDVGANKGQFSLVARHLFPTAQIHAFEPLESERRIYQSVVRGPVQMHSVALGATRGGAKFFVASRADSSSLLSPGKNQQAAYGVGVASTIEVDVERLADVLKPGDLVGPVLLKLDVQGAELQVLQGADAILPVVGAIYCEVSFVELYEGQPTAGAIVAFLDRLGFAFRGVFNLSLTKQFGPTQGDFLFSRISEKALKQLGANR
jgi:FkbM family methyltransferase